MVETHRNLYINDLMRSFEKTKIEPGRGGLVIASGGRAWRLCFLHAALDQENPATANRRGGLASHVHDEAYHVLLYTKGGSSFSHLGREIEARRGTLVLMPPGEEHSFAPLGTEPTIYTEATFAFLAGDGSPLRLSINELLGAYAGCVLGRPGFPLQADARQESQLMGIFSRIMDGLEAGGVFGELAAQQAMGEMFLYLVKEFLVQPDDAAKPHPGLVTAKAHIEARYREVLTIPKLAHMAHLSPGYFQRAFLSAYGVTPMAYQARLRIEAARTLLSFSDVPCKEIAARLGYSDVYHFNKAFAGACGQPPARFRTAQQRTGNRPSN